MAAIALLYPRYDHSAIEERYASWQTQMLLKRGEEQGPLLFYDTDERATDVVAEVDAEYVLVVTDPHAIPTSRLGVRLRDLLGDAAAAVPVTNRAAHPKQQRTPPVQYLTLRELQEAAEALTTEAASSERVTWDASDPGIYLCRTATLDRIKARLAEAMAGLQVVISGNDYVHRWGSLRGQTRYDLLERISPEARSILEFGCGEAPLGEALKKRQKCRVVGIELDAEAAAIARRRIDSVYLGDVRDIVAILDERFDWIIGGDIVEHLEEPWSFLADLRRVTTPGGRLLLSIPNLANASVINDLLHGRFDYVYMGLTCVGHLRFFTRQSLHDMLTIAGWNVVEITPQDIGPTPGREQLFGRLEAAGIPFAKEELLPTGFYVIAQNPA